MVRVNLGNVDRRARLHLGQKAGRRDGCRRGVEYGRVRRVASQGRFIDLGCASPRRGIGERLSFSADYQHLTTIYRQTRDGK
jgi:hypothetical protein